MRCSTVTTSCMPSSRIGPTTSARLIFADAWADSSESLRQGDELERLELLGTDTAGFADRPRARRSTSPRDASPPSASELRASCAGVRTQPRRRVGRREEPGRRHARRRRGRTRPEVAAGRPSARQDESRPCASRAAQDGDCAVGLRSRARRRTGRRPRAAPSRTSARRGGRRSRLSTTSGVAMS